MPSNIVALPTADAEVIKLWLDALVAATEEKANVVCHRVLATY
jgi:hypothetical protein